MKRCFPFKSTILAIALGFSGWAYAQPTAPVAQPQNDVQARVEATIGALYVQNAQCTSQVVAAAAQVATLNKQLKDANDQVTTLKKQLAEAQATHNAPANQAPPPK